MTTLGQVRQVISAEVSDTVLRRRLLQLAGSSSEAWAGCEARDVVGVLMEELAQRDKEEAAVRGSVTGEAKSSCTDLQFCPRAADQSPV